MSVDSWSGIRVKWATAFGCKGLNEMLASLTSSALLFSFVAPFSNLVFERGHGLFWVVVKLKGQDIILLIPPKS
jgi:hypothetical protein